MKEKKTYRRFNLLAILAILGCGAMLLFEGFFIFELYNRAPDRIAELLPDMTVPSVEAPVAPAPAMTNPAVNPAEVPPAEIETAPAVAAPVG